MQITPVIAIHLAAALAAVAIGPIALWARQGATQRPRLHRAAGYAWVTLMVATAVSALFITGGPGPRWGSFGLIHLLIPVTLGMLAMAFVFLARRNIVGHRKMINAPTSAPVWWLAASRCCPTVFWATRSGPHSD